MTLPFSRYGLFDSHCTAKLRDATSAASAAAATPVHFFFHGSLALTPHDVPSFVRKNWEQIEVQV